MKPGLCATKANSRTTSAQKPNGTRDEGVPLGAAVQAEARNDPLGVCEDSSLRDASASPAGSEGRSPSKSKLFPPRRGGGGSTSVVLSVVDGRLCRDVQREDPRMDQL